MMTRQSCLGGCGVTVLRSASLPICSACHEAAWSWLRPRLPRVGSEARRPAINRFWASASAVRGALDELREGVAV